MFRKMPRPRSKNYKANTKRLIQQLQGSGYTVTPPPNVQSSSNVNKSLQKYDPSAQDEKQFEASPLHTLTTSFMKSLAYAQRRKQDIKDKVVLYSGKNRLTGGDGVIYRPQDRISYAELRVASENTSIAGAIHQMRADDARLHGSLSEELGFWFEEEGKKQTDMKRIRELGTMLVHMGKRDGPTWQNRDRLPDVLEMATRDILSIDRVAYLVSRTRAGEIMSIQYLDPATIFCTDPQIGYRGNQKITHVQVIDGQVAETFNAGQIYLRSKNKRSDIRYRYEGFSPVESCINELLAMVHALKNNMDRFNRRKPPNMLFSTKSNLSEASRQVLEELWENYFNGQSDQFRFPIIDGLESLEAHNLGIENDMIFERLMKWVATLVFVRHGTDPAELGMRLESSQTISEPSLDGRAKLSRDRAHGAIMRFHESCLSDLLELELQDKPIRFYFTGVTTENKDHILDRNIKKLSNFLPLGKVLNEMGLPKYSEIVTEFLPDDQDAQDKAKKLDLAILNPHFMNLFGQLIVGQEQPELGEQGADEDYEDDDYAVEDEQDEEYSPNEIAQSG